MSTLRITNVSDTPLWLRDLYTELSPGETATITRTPAEMGDMIGLQEFLTDGLVTADIDLDPHEAPSELVAVWPLGFNWRPVVPNTASLPVLKNRLGDVRMVLATLSLFVWNGATWIGLGGGGGGAPSDASFLTVTANAALSNERVLTVSADLTLTDGGPNTSLTLGMANTGVAAGTYGAGDSVPVVTIDSKGRVTNISTASNFTAHEGYDTLAHNLVESNYQEVSYSAGMPTAITYWATSAKLLKLRETLFSYTGDMLVSSVTERQFDGAGTQTQQLVHTYSYNPDETLLSISTVRT